MGHIAQFRVDILQSGQLVHSGKECKQGSGNCAIRTKIA